MTIKGEFVTNRKLLNAGLIKITASSILTN